jgi:hypothetical protein
MSEKKLHPSHVAHAENNTRIYHHMLTGIEQMNEEEIEEDADETLDSDDALLSHLADTLHIRIPARPSL